MTLVGLFISHLMQKLFTSLCGCHDNTLAITINVNVVAEMIVVGTVSSIYFAMFKAVHIAAKFVADRAFLRLVMAFPLSELLAPLLNGIHSTSLLLR